MFNKISAADARKKFANIINRVAYGKESFVLTRRGEPLALCAGTLTIGLFYGIVLVSILSLWSFLRREK